MYVDIMSNIMYRKYKFGVQAPSYQKIQRLEDELPKLLKLWKNQFLTLSTWRTR